MYWTYICLCSLPGRPNPFGGNIPLKNEEQLFVVFRVKFDIWDCVSHEYTTS